MINQSENTLDDRLFRRISDLERQLSDIKTLQLTGAGNQSITSTSLIDLTMPINAGDTSAIVISYNSAVHRLYLSEFKPSFFINNDYNSLYQWPNGPSILPSNLTVSGPWCDGYYSDELTYGRKAYMLSIKNNTASSLITLYFHGALIFPTQTVT